MRLAFVALAVATVKAGQQTLSQTVSQADDVVPTSLVELGAQWRFGSNYVPQHYGQWKFAKGSWNFGNDKRIECEACGYVTYMLIDRLGDNFNAVKVKDAMANLCTTDVQWVFQSACKHIFKEFNDKILNLVMRLTEPEDICKHINLCAPDFYDSMMAGGSWASAPGVFPAHGMGAPAAGGMGAGMNFNQLGSPISMQTPGAGFSNGNGGTSPYPTPGSKPITTGSAYSPYSYGGYDPYGFPTATPGVPSSTPPPPASGEAAKAL